MTDVSNLDELANAIASSSSKIKAYAKAQAAATQSQEADIRALLQRVAALEAEEPQPEPEPPPPSGNLTLDSRDDLGQVFNERCLSVIPRGFRFVTTVNDPPPWDAGAKGCLAQVPGVFSPPGTVEEWSFDVRFPAAGNPEGFPRRYFAGTLWQWHHARNDIVSPVGSGCHLAIDGRDDAGDEGLHFKVVQPIRAGGTVNDFEYGLYAPPGRPPVRFDHTYHIEIALRHSGGSDGFFMGKIDGVICVDYHGPNLPTNPGGQDPYLQFGHYSVREKTNTVEFTNIVRHR